MKRIVFNRHDGGVSICAPTDWAISMMGCGGLWDEFPRGYMEVQIERQIARGVPKDVARRYALAMQFGGCTTAESLEIIRDRDCAPHGTAMELWDYDDVPTDRWFRDAWCRSHNGGPISISMKLARPIQLKHIGNALKLKNDKRQSELLAPIECDIETIRQNVLMARDEVELRLIWPRELISE